MHQLWITPHGVLKAAQRNRAAAQTRSEGGASVTALKFSEPGRFDAVAIIGADGLVQRVESRAPDAGARRGRRGDALFRTTATSAASSSRAASSRSVAGHPVLDLTVRDVQPNAPVDIALPDAVRNAAERVTTEKLADGVWHVGGGSHNSVAIEMRDHLVLVETPLNDGRSAAGDRRGEGAGAGQADPLRDQLALALRPCGRPARGGGRRRHRRHAGGQRAVFRARVRARRRASHPTGSRSRAGAPAFLAVNDKASLSDGARTIDIHRITDSVHNDTFLMVHLPNEKILIEADAYTPLAPERAAAGDAECEQR